MNERIKKWVGLFIIFICNRLPIKNNKVFLFSYYGSQFGCNPKYISNYIKDFTDHKFDIVWAFNDPQSKAHIPQIRTVKTMSLKYFYGLCTAKVVITNFRTTDLYVKRKGQYYIQTWHSSLRLKQIEKDAAKVLPDSYIRMAQKDSVKCDLVLSGCKYSTDIFKKSFWYAGEIFEHGIPRNDLLLKNNDCLIGKVKKELGISSNKKVLLYAPTFRKDNNLTVYNIDYSKLVIGLSEKFGGDWVVLVKLHPHLALRAKELTESESVINVTAFDDIQELLVVTDVLISDYSSLMFDFAITKRPCFLYVPDLVTYTEEDRGLYFDIKKLPFIHAMSNQDLLKNIHEFKLTAYKKNVTQFLDDVGSYEEGHANKYLLKRIEEVCFNDNRRGTNEAV